MKMLPGFTGKYNPVNPCILAPVEGWMESPGHRKNLLNPEFELIGIGIGIGEKDGIPYAWITQNFGAK